jgi:hypothetical protein
MGKERIVLTICFCLIVALAGFSGWLYLAAKGLESKVSDLESKTSSLETQNAELNEKVQNLTDWWDALLNASTFTFTETEELKITGILWGSNYANLTVTNTGASDLTISGVKVDQAATTGVIGGNTIPTTPYTLVKGTTMILKINNISSANWVSGTKYTFAVLTAAGNQYEYPATKP